MTIKVLLRIREKLTQKILTLEKNGNRKMLFHILSLSVNKKLGEILGNVIDVSMNMVIILLRLEISLTASGMPG